MNLADGTQASEGDLVITRSNDRRLRTLRGGWVRNGDRWRVTHVGKDGSMTVQRVGVALGGSVTLPAAYVAEHVDLGYAVTAHRAQGLTVDTSHVVVSGTTTRENLYVVDDARPRVEHRVRRARQARREARPARARRGERPHRALRRAPALRRGVCRRTR